MFSTHEMDEAPNCAICNAPAYPECPCEADRMQIAVKQAEARIMEDRLSEIRYEFRPACGCFADVQAEIG